MSPPGLGHVLVLALALFVMGAFCALVRRNLLMIVLGVEVMLNACSIALVGASLAWGDLEGQAFVIFVLAVAATEVTVGLVLAVHAFARKRSLDPGAFRLLE